MSKFNPNLICKEKACEGLSQKNATIRCYNPIAKAKSQKPSLRLAVNAHCYMFMGGEITDPKTRNSILQDVYQCASEICPLRPVRPINTKKLQD